MQLSMFKVLRRSAMKDLIDSVHSAFLRLLLITEPLTPSWEHWCSPESNQGLAASHSLLWSSPYPGEAGKVGVMGTVGTDSLPNCLISHIKSGPELGQSQGLLTSNQMGQPSGPPTAPEGPLSWRPEEIPPLEAVFRDSRRVLTVSGVQSPGWRIFSSSVSLEVRRGWKPCYPLPSTPE